MTDTMKKIECPACGSEMKKIYVEEAGVCVDICTEGCGGVFFDNKEFEKFDEPTENADAIFAELEGRTFQGNNEKEVRICPVCNVSMAKVGSGKFGIQFDVCNSCGAKFLDKGELERYREGVTPDTTNVDKLIDELCEASIDKISGNIGRKAPITAGLRNIVQRIVYKYLMK